MVALESLIDTLRERLKTEAMVRVPASLEEYFELIQDCEFDVEYIDHEIVATMSQASEIHELLVATIIRLLGNAFLNTESRVYGSNRPIYVADCQRAFNADALVVKGKTELFQRERAIAATLNPMIVVEVLSESNKDKDFTEKLNCYKKIPSLQQIIQIDQYKPFVSTYVRLPQPHQWLNTDYNSMDELILVSDFEIPMRDLYRNVFES
jgi:Uma2 family endonuclease